MGSIASALGHDRPRLIEEGVSGGTAMIEDVLEGSENAVVDLVVTHKLPNVLGGVPFGSAGRKRHQGDVLGTSRAIVVSQPARSRSTME